MGILSKFTVTPLLWACGILLAAVAALTVTIVVKDARAAATLAKVTAVKDGLVQLAEQRRVRIDELNGANAMNKQAVDELAARLAAEVGKGQDTQRALDAAVAERDTATRARDRALDTLQRSRETTYATDTDCADWGNRPVCAAISDSLQRQWDEARQLPAGAGPDRGGEGPPAGAD